MTTSQLTHRILTLHSTRFPKWEIQDAVKLLYQSEFGPDQARENTSAEALAGELSQAQAEAYRPPYMVEAIGDGLCRFHLYPQRLTESDMALLDRCLKTPMYSEGTTRSMWEKLGILAGLARAKSGPQAGDQVEFFLTRWAEEGCPPLHHSELYRESYHPHYQVISRSLAAWFPALQAIEQALHATDGPVLVAIDGPSASGKTSFARWAAKLFPCSVFHMDDYLLPEEQQTEEHLAQPGGIIDCQRLEHELLLPLSRGENTQVPFRRLNLIEGTYALLPQLEPYSQVHILFTCTPEVQLFRLAQRETQEQLEQFCDKWIPLEEAHLSGLDQPALCNVVIDTSRLPPPPETIP